MRAEEAARPGVDLGDAATLQSIVAARGGVGGSPSRAPGGRPGEATHVRLDRERIESLGEEFAGFLPATTHLYLQHNRLRRPGGVLGLGALRFLTLAHNALEDLQGFSALSRLLFLDVSHNRIRTCGPGDLPAPLRFLKIEGNPCSAEPARAAALRVALVSGREDLEEIDGQPFTPEELLAAGYDPDSDWEEEERRGELAEKFRVAEAAAGGGGGGRWPRLGPDPAPRPGSQCLSSSAKLLLTSTGRSSSSVGGCCWSATGHCGGKWTF